LAGKGYLRVVVGEPKKQETERGSKIILPIEEGALYRLSKVEIEGSTVFSQKQLLEMLKLKVGDIANGAAIREWLYERGVKSAYADKGYIHYECDVEPDFKIISESEGLVDLKVTIYEGPRFTIRRIEFAGNANTPDQVLHDALSIKEDEPFSRRLLDETVMRLNDLGLFERIDSDRDVDFRTDGESSWLDITIHVKEKVDGR
jgi:outer membrane protein insertion porin family